MKQKEIILDNLIKKLKAARELNLNVILYMSQRTKESLKDLLVDNKLEGYGILINNKLDWGEIQIATTPVSYKISAFTLADSEAIVKVIEDIHDRHRPARVVCIETGKVYKSIKAASEAIGKNVQPVFRHTQQTAGGYHWMYYDEYYNNLINEAIKELGK